ncbi:NAD(P)/FAD-dependent oxidoreductase [Qaidamihabitans albus]|uniref:NAD(P)/FAD-dependent oxidoreductase n=1 Tax=Qaidamihabitans albus TaxID=2795733 RepID=UPI0018F1EDB9|nr:FAD-dependent oxidoreductase [Qaidamihabitans albus]
MNSANTPVVVVGASVAGMRVAQALRSRGYDRPVVLIDRENGTPYDKPALSKAVLTSPETNPPALLDEVGLRALDVDLRAGTTVTGLDPTARHLVTSDGERIAFGPLVIATGSAPRRARPLDRFGGVHYLRTWAEAEAIRSAFASRPRVVVVGGGFIGGEVASSARQLGLDVTIVEAGPRLLGRLMPSEVAKQVAQMHGEHSVRVVCGRSVVGGYGTTEIEALELDDGTRLPADLVIVGIGTTPVTTWLEDAGLSTTEGVRCDSELAVHGLRSAWAVGDVAAWTDAATGRVRRTEHWTTAREQASYAANAIVDPAPQRPFRTTGYVWSDQHGVRIQHVGEADATTTTRSQPAGGDERGWLFVHHRGDDVVGATAFNAPRELLEIRRRLADTRNEAQEVAQ